jgi:L,D-transpeptidase YcbB
LEAHLYRFFAVSALIATTMLPAGPALPASERIEHAVAEFRTLTGQRAIWAEPALREALLQQIWALHDDGLDPEHYAFRTLRDAPADSRCLEDLATRAYLHALDDLRHGRLDPQEVEPLWHSDVPPGRTEAIVLARQAAEGLGDLAASFESARPDVPAYAPLRRHLAELRSRSTMTEAPRVPAGPMLRPGEVHPAVAILRERLAQQGFGVPPEGDPMRFDDALVAMLQQFQHAHTLKPDGVLGPASRRELNQDLETRIVRTRINLERWRWLASELKPTQLRVDIAAAELRYLREGELRWSARVQVGRGERPTPLLHSAVSHITLNPPWVVPPTILRKDKLPAIRANPRMLEDSDMRVFDRSGAELDPATIDWNAPGPITLRQDPGPRNALGQAAIRFPNPFSVYLHDTPSQMQFTSWQRTFSSGCVRVERALELAELLLADGADITPEKVAAALGDGRTRNLHLQTPIPILMAYWTADADADGELRWRPDIYGHDLRIAAALERTDEHDIPRCEP